MISYFDFDFFVNVGNLSLLDGMLIYIKEAVLFCSGLFLFLKYKAIFEGQQESNME